MSDFTLMRENMVKGQLLPENINNTLILQSFSTIPREKFFPRQLSHIAYMDAPFCLQIDRCLLRPATLAHLLSTIKPKPTDSILYVASGTGYGPALLGQLGAHVVALDSEEQFTQATEKQIQELELSTVQTVLGPLQEGWDAKAPYDKIVIDGCVEYVPEPLISQLKEGGTIATFKQSKVGTMKGVELVKKNGLLTEASIFDAFAPRLKAFHKDCSFIF